MTPDMPSEDGWTEHRIFVTKTLERLERLIDEHEERDETRHIELLQRISSIQNDISSLNVKAGVWGLLGGAIPTAIALIILYLDRHHGSPQ